MSAAAQRHRAASHPGAGGGGPIRADVLPNDVSEDAPSVLRWEKGGEIMQLPLRDARRSRARISAGPGHALRRQYLAHRHIRRMERSALHRKLKSLGLHGGASTTAASFKSSEGCGDGALRVRQWTVCRSSHGQCAYRGIAAISLPMASYEVVGVHDGRLIDEGPHRPARPLVG